MNTGYYLSIKLFKSTALISSIDVIVHLRTHMFHPLFGAGCIRFTVHCQTTWCSIVSTGMWLKKNTVYLKEFFFKLANASFNNLRGLTHCVVICCQNVLKKPFQIDDSDIIAQTICMTLLFKRGMFYSYLVRAPQFLNILLL